MSACIIQGLGGSGVCVAGRKGHPRTGEAVRERGEGTEQQDGLAENLERRGRKQGSQKEPVSPLADSPWVFCSFIFLSVGQLVLGSLTPN